MHFIETTNPRNIKLILTNKEYPILSFGDYFKLDYYKRLLLEAGKKGDKEGFVRYIESILELQTKDEIDLSTKEPKLILRSVFDIIIENGIKADIVFLTPPPKDPLKKEKEEKKDRIDYEGRFFTQLIDILVRRYHWTFDYIYQLNLDSALYFIQECLVGEYYEKEFIYRLSELAYSYNSNSKKSEYRPLPKPYWMNEDISGEIPKTKILKGMLPMGVTNVSGMEDEITRYLEQISPQKPN